MSDRAALLAAICASPDDDTARLAFADWLDENGTAKDTRRAAYIRADVGLHRLRSPSTPATAFARYVEDHTNTSLDLFPEAWAAVDPEIGAISAAARAREAVRLSLPARAEGLPKVLGVRFDNFERGFHSLVHVRNPNAFLANAPAIFRAAPVTGVTFERLNPEQARRFVADGHLKRVRQLRLRDAGAGVVRTLGDHPDAAGVTSLILECGLFSREPCEELGAAAHWTGLTRLEVTDLDMSDGEGDEIAVALLRHPRFRRLRHLSLYGNGIGDETAEAIATLGFKELRALDLGVNDIGDDGAEAIAQSKSLAGLLSLDASLNNFGPRGMSVLIASQRLANLAVLRLDGCYGGGLEAKALKGPGRGPTLRALHLEGMDLTAAGMAAFASCPAVHGLWQLRMELCSVTDGMLRALTRSKGFRSLTVLDLANNNLTAAGAEVLAKWGVPLRWLDLMENKIGVPGAKALIASEHLQGLRRLLVTGAGAANLRKHFGKKVVL